MSKVYVSPPVCLDELHFLKRNTFLRKEYSGNRFMNLKRNIQTSILNDVSKVWIPHTNRWFLSATHETCANKMNLLPKRECTQMTQYADTGPWLFALCANMAFVIAQKIFDHLPPWWCYLRIIQNHPLVCILHSVA